MKTITIPPLRHNCFLLNSIYSEKNVVPLHDTRVDGVSTAAEGQLHLFLSTAIDGSK